MISIKKTKRMKEVEVKCNEELVSLMHRLYVMEDMIMDDICIYMGIPRKTLIEWMRLSHIFSHKLKTLEERLDSGDNG